MYEHFFGLKKKPFDLVPNPDFLYLSATHKKALTYLDYAVREKAGFILLTGEAGSGKTTLLRDFINRLDKNVTVAKVFNTTVTFEQLIAMINEDFGLDSRGKNKVVLLKELYSFLIEEHGKGGSPLLIIDEAQNLSPAVLEEIRMLSNLETDDAKLLQIVLAGQPELATILSLAELRQLRQRISITCNLYPLTRQECEAYIRRRLEVAGNAEALFFSPEAVDGIYAYSNGIPRLVNVLCNFILLAAFNEETRTVNREMVDDLIRELQTEAQAHVDRNGLSERKRALLQALGAPVPSPANEDDEEELRGSSKREKNIRLLLKDLDLRVNALEKAQARTEELVARLMQRLELLEKREPEQENPESMMSDAWMWDPDKETEESAAVQCMDGTNGKKSFFKRIFGIY